LNQKFHSVDELVLNAEFRNWVMDPDSHSNLYWEKYLAEHSDQADMVKEAMELVKGMATIDYKPSPAYQNQIWERVSQQIEGLEIEESKVIPISQKAVIGKYESPQSTSKRWIYKIAAAVALLVSISFLIDNLEPIGGVAEPTIVTKESARGHKTRFTLPDGTSVIMNSESTLTYDQSFNENERKVTLTGEAFFDVVKNPNKPFIVETDQIDVTVLGTSFNVKTYRDEATIDVAVKSGHVMVNTKDQKQQVSLLPDYMSTFHINSSELKMHEIINSNEVFGWTDRNLEFDDTPFNEVTRTLSRWYNVDFVLDEKLNAEEKITAKCGNATLRQVLESLSHTYEFNYEIHDNSIFIEPK